MNVLMVSTSYPRDAADWRGRFVFDMAASVSRQDGVSLTLWGPPGALPTSVEYAASPAEAAWLNRMAESGGVGHLLRQNPLGAGGAALGLLSRLHRTYRRLAPDVVHANWLQNALPLWGSRIPAVIAVLGSDFGLLRLPLMRSAVRAMLRARRAILVPNAEWMVPKLERQFGDLAEVRPISFGVAAEWFEVQREPVAPAPAQWIVVSRVTRDKIGDLTDWGEGLFGQKRVLHLLGPMQEEISLPAWVRHHGPTHPVALQSTWFPRATGLITLSRHDEGRPQVMLEAMAAGLPVVASDLAAHRDFVRQGETGLIVGSREEFSAALRRLESPDENRRIGAAARAWVREHIGIWDDCARRYVALYRQLAGSEA